MWAVLLSAGQVSAITLSELRQIIAESQNDVATTAHLVYIEELNNNQPLSGDENDVRYKIRMIHKHRLTKVDAILDHDTELVRSTLTDLRDIDKLLKDNNLPPEQKVNVIQSKILLYQGSYVGGLIPAANFSNMKQTQFILSEAPGPARYMFNDLSLGSIDRNMLSNDWNPKLTEVNGEDESFLRIELTEKGQNSLKRIIECDQSLGYRFRRILSYQDDKLAKEIIADDYRDVDGVPYPFLYICRSFDENGEILIERKQVFQNINLGIDLSESDFTVFLPTGTVITDYIISHRATEVKLDCYMSIADILGISTQEIVQKELAKLIIHPNPLPSKQTRREIFVPNADVAQKEDKLFVLDLARAALVKAPVADKLDTENIYNYLTKLGKGDIAWNGSLITLRKAKALSIGDESKHTFKYTANQWSGSCKLPQILELPYTLLIVSKEGLNYLVTVEKIETDGIYIASEKLEPDELKRYRPVED